MLKNEAIRKMIGFWTIFFNYIASELFFDFSDILDLVWV